MKRCVWLLGVGVLLLLLESVPAQPRQAVLPDAELAPLVTASVQQIAEALNGEPNRKTADKARVTAVMLAAFAQQNLAGADGTRRATLRDTALEIAGLIKDKKYVQARQQAQKLAGLPANPKARTERSKLMGPQLDIEELMSQFRVKERGGLGSEALFDQLTAAKDGTISAQDLTDELRLLAWRTAVAGELTLEHTPDKNVKGWQTLAKAMQKSSTELAEAVKAKDGKTAYKSVTALVDSCNKCHKEFR